MGTVLEKANKIKETKNKIKEIVNYNGEIINNTTIFNDYDKKIKNDYINIIKNGTKVIYNNFPKVTEEGHDLTLITEEAPMNFILKGNTSQNTKILPDEYTQLDYIESNGTQHIDSLVYGNLNTEIEAKITCSRSGGAGQLFGDITTQSSAISCNIDINSNQTSRFGNKTISTNFNNYIEVNVPCQIKENKNGIYINSELVSSFNTETDFTTSKTLLIFSRNGSSLTSHWYGRVYYFKIYNNNVLVRDLIPCYRNSDNEIGMYDLIDNIFFTNLGSGVFTYGKEINIPNPDYPQEIKMATGEQNIKIKGINLFDPINSTNNTDYVLNTDNSITMSKSYGSDGRKFFNSIYLEAGTYTLSYIPILTGNTNERFSIANLTASTNIVNQNLAIINNQKITYTFTLNNPAEIGICIMPNQSASGTLTLKNIMLKLGSTSTNYIKYQGQNYNINLGNIELYKIGDYQDEIYYNNNKWYLEKNIGKSILNGTETVFNFSNGVLYSNNYLPNNTYIPNIKIYSNYFEYGGYAANSSSAYNKGNGKICDNLDGDSIYFRNDNLTSLEEWKNWLIQNNVIFYYILANPIYTEIIDDTLLSQLNNLKNNIKSCSEITKIETISLNNNKPININASALKNINLIESEW